MDTVPTSGDRGHDADAQPAGPEEAVMWWIIGFVALFAGIAFVISRRGPGDGLDHSGDPGRHDPLGGTYRGGGDGGGGGGA